MKRIAALVILISAVAMPAIAEEKKVYFNFRHAGALSIGTIVKADLEFSHNYVPFGFSGHVSFLDLTLWDEAHLSVLGLGVGYMCAFGEEAPYGFETAWKRGAVVKFPIIYIAPRNDNFTIGIWYGTNKYFNKSPAEEIHFLAIDIGIVSIGSHFR